MRNIYAMGGQGCVFLTKVISTLTAHASAYTQVDIQMWIDGHNHQSRLKQP